MIKERVAKITETMSLVKSHPMCARFIDDGSRFLVVYPAGDFPVHGTRVSYAERGKAWALSTMLEKMESHWVASYPNAR